MSTTKKATPRLPPVHEFDDMSSDLLYFLKRTIRLTSKIEKCDDQLCCCERGTKRYDEIWIKKQRVLKDWHFNFQYLQTELIPSFSESLIYITQYYDRYNNQNEMPSAAAIDFVQNAL